MKLYVFWTFGFLWSAFFGWYALDFLGRGIKPEDTKWNTKHRFTPGIVYQVLLNFWGSATGWTALYYFCFHRIRDSLVKNEPINLGAVDLAIAAIAVVGVLGFIPFTVSKINKLP
ncbi:MAG: hypothetical protein HY316_01650 [Acidobacteria bacterium]|nr:hypothetical protein [Acidobacteriota bacterium]